MSIPGLAKYTRIKRKSVRNPKTGRMDTTEKKSSVFLSIQPAPGVVVDRMAAGYRADDVKVVYVPPGTVLLAANPKIGQVSDMVEYDDGDGLDRWEVDGVGNWDQILPHHETVITRIKEPG